MDENLSNEIELTIETSTEVLFDESGSEVTESETVPESEVVTETESEIETQTEPEELLPDPADQEPIFENILEIDGEKVLFSSGDGTDQDVQLLSSTGSGASSSAALEEKIDHISATLDLISVVLVFWIGYFILGSFRSWLIKGGRSNWNH